MPPISNDPAIGDELILEDGGCKAETVSKFCLIGKVLAPKILNRNAVSSIINSAWKLRGTLTISAWSDNIFLFHFTEVEERNRILFESPWSIMGSLLVLRTLSAGQTAAEVDFNWCSFWVQAYGLPFHNMTRQTGEILGRQVGHLVQVEAQSEGLLLNQSFLRFCVAINLQEPLPKGVWLKRPQGGSAIWVFFKYERLSDFCYDCGRIGHDNKICKFVSKEQGLAFSYGPELRTGAVKSWGLQVDQLLRKEKELFVRASPPSSHRSKQSASPSFDPTAACNQPGQKDTVPHSYTSFSGTELCTRSSAFPETDGTACSETGGTLSPETPGLAVIDMPPSLTSIEGDKIFLSSQPPHHTDDSSSLDLTTKVGPALERSTSALRPTTSSTGPAYYVTEPPDNPRTSTPTLTSGELGLSLQTPGPLPQSLAPSYALDSCLSKALKSLSFKRKNPEELQPSSRPPKLLRYDAPSSLVSHISEPLSPSLVDGIGLYSHGPPTARQPTNAHLGVEALGFLEGILCLKLRFKKLELTQIVQLSLQYR
ncbi:hypothetical protein LOK49_LG06G01269 [Camellia lanceoleosa]|uniref:Uncharacterized protein n=1 Tax=Camellia lanceoleosa TaxID=1840588 RepID=A0ACC0H9V7_9ERIC|nr:hypothetical protein LOK49_LG06G01269 [Camellia lanceoleosa]